MHASSITSSRVSILKVGFLLAVLILVGALVQLERIKTANLRHKSELDRHQKERFQLNEKARRHKMEVNSIREKHERDQPVIENAGPYLWMPFRDPQYVGLHVVITSLCLSQGDQSNIASSRIKLFLNICLPSMLAQRLQNFLWLIYVDDTLPEARRLELTEALRGRPNFQIVRILPALKPEKGKPVDTTPPPQTMSVEKQLELAKLPWYPSPAGTTPVVITTRLDSDDALHKLATLQIRMAAEDWTRTTSVQRKSFFCWTEAVAWIPTSAAAVGGFALEVPRKGAEQGCTSSGLTMVTKDVGSRTVFWEGNNEAPAERSPDTIRERLTNSLVKPFPTNVESPSVNRTPVVLPEDPASILALPLRGRTVVNHELYLFQPATSSTPYPDSAKIEERIAQSYSVTLKALADANHHFVRNERGVVAEVLNRPCKETTGVSCEHKEEVRATLNALVKSWRKSPRP